MTDEQKRLRMKQRFEQAAREKRLPESPKVETPKPTRPPVIKEPDNPYAVGIAQTKEFIGAAVLCFWLYVFAWPIGLVANIRYLQHARSMERLAGHDLPGTGWLQWLFVIGVLIFILEGIFVIVTFHGVR